MDKSIGNITHKTGSTSYVVKNIFQDLDIGTFNKIFEPYISDYTVQSQRPEELALQLYGEQEYTYILFYINNISNVANEWPLDDLSFKSYIIKKYGSIANAKGTIKYYYDRSSNRITELTAQSLLETIDYTTMSVYEYEEFLNEIKSEIKIIEPSAIESIIAQVRNYKRTGKYEG